LARRLYRALDSGQISVYPVKELSPRRRGDTG
jgi:hypothetical protein